MAKVRKGAAAAEATIAQAVGRKPFKKKIAATQGARIHPFSWAPAYPLTPLPSADFQSPAFVGNVRAELEFGPGARAEPFVSYCSVTRLLFEICGEEGYVYRIAERTSYFVRLEEGLNNRAGFLIARKPAGMWWSVRTRPVSGSDKPDALTHWRAIGTLRSLTKEARIQL